MLSWNIKLASAIGFSIAMASSVGFFLITVPGGWDWRQFWIVGIGATLSAIPIGWWLGRWYLPVHKTHLLFKYFMCPLAALVLSLFTGFTIFTVWVLIFEPHDYGSFISYALGYAFSLFIGTAAFLSIAWPAVVIAFGAAGMILVKYSKVAPTNSFKRTAAPKLE
jgi:hypothetical protein